jgi:ribonuclease HI
MECLQEIEDKLYESQNNIIDLNPLKESLDNIIKTITSTNIVADKKQLLNQINEYQNIINQEDEKVKLNQASKYDKNQINDAWNMLENFKNKLYLTIDLDELNNLKTEFENEKIKYF